MMQKFFTSLVLCFSGVTWAAKNENVAILINQGDLVSEFKLDAATNTMTLTNSQGLKRTRKLNAENYKFVMAEAKSLPKAKHLPLECNRARMSVMIGSGKSAKVKSSCFGMKSITSQKYEQLANLLAIEI